MTETTLTESAFSCSVCQSPASVTMLDVNFCGSCFQSLSTTLQTRLSPEEMTLFLRGQGMSKDTQLIVSIVLSQLFRANAVGTRA